MNLKEAQDAALERLTVEWAKNGQQLSRELEKHVLSSGSWATVMFLYQEWDHRESSWRMPKARVVRYKFNRRLGEYQYKSKFVVSSPTQAKRIAIQLTDWLPTQEASCA